MKPLLPPAFALWEPHINSFVAFCPPSQHDEDHPGPLSGLSAGIKDIIDVAGVATRNGSATMAHAPPATVDAPVVAALRAGGARIIGKTTTTEYATTDPTACRNPHDVTRSPGGSSSGSGAAVAAGLVDFALGTQTAGSLCRPAAYCGVIGLKPSYGVLSTQGVTPLAQSFDSVGVIARSIDVATRAFVAMTGQSGVPTTLPVKIGALLLPTDEDPAPEMRLALEAATTALGRGCFDIRHLSLHMDVGGIVAAHRCGMLAEAAQAHARLLAPETVDLLQPKFRAGLEVGRAITAAQVTQARTVLAQATQAFWREVDDVDAILTLPVPDGAPLMDGTTGFQDWLTPWTVFGGPLISVPWGLDTLGRPRAVMLTGRPGMDLELLALAQKLEAVSPAIPAPKPPLA